MCAGFRSAEPAVLNRFCKSVRCFGQCDGIEDIVLHPRAETDMPAVPIIRQCCGKIRLAEVLDHVNPEDLCSGAGNIDAPGKVRIDLQRIKHDRKAKGRAAECLRSFGNRPDRRGGMVGNHQFFEQAPQGKFQAEFDACKLETVLFQKLTCQLIIPADRSLKQLRKETDKERIFPEIPLCPYISPRDIDHIAHGLKGIK